MSSRLTICIALSLLIAAGCSDDDLKPPRDTGTAVDKSAVDTVAIDATASDKGAGDAGDAGDAGGGDLATSSLKTCQRQCKTVSDCCKTPPCDKMPLNPVCRPSGYCFNKGCATDTDCSSAGSNLKCLTFLSMGLCALPCKKDADCSGSQVCVAGTYCSNLATKKAFECTSDADCSTPAESKCDTASGVCGCVSDTACLAQYASTYGGTWRCMPFSP